MNHFQKMCTVWARTVFGVEAMNSREERALRFIEEGIELAQACGLSRDQVTGLVEHVYDRPLGARYQEVGGVMLTLAALCSQLGFDMHRAGWAELERCLPLMDKIREKQKRKPAAIRGVKYEAEQ